MPNPNVPQGTLNRLRAAVQIPSFPQLTVTPPFLGKRSIILRPNGKLTTTIETETGGVQSPEPYLMYEVEMDLLRSQGFADLWKQQIELSTLLGDITVIMDTSTLSRIQLSNCSIMRPGELDFGGDNPSFPVTLSGFYYINNSLWP